MPESWTARALTNGWRWTVLCALFLPGIWSCTQPTAGLNRQSISLNGTWDFYPDGGGRRHSIQVPSFWDAPQDYDYPSEWLHLSHGVYRRSFDIPPSVSTGRVILRLERLSVLGQVFVNGKQTGGEETDGYLMMQLPYTIDITELVRRDQPNQLEVRVWGGQSIVHGQDELNSRLLDFPADAFDEGKLLYPYGVDHYDGRRGINGDVKVLFYPDVYISDIHVISDLKKNSDPNDDELAVSVEVTNTMASPVEVTVVPSIFSNRGSLELNLEVRPALVPPGKTVTVGWPKFHWPEASYWWPDEPVLYRLVSQLRLTAGGSNDRRETQFGIREFFVDGNRFFLNGTPINLRGDAFEFSWHEGYRHGPSTAPVISTRELVPQLQLRLLQEYRGLNMNALRPHKASGISQLYDWCDQMGMLVMDEAPFWETFQRTDERAIPNYQAWVSRWVKERRNHPSIVMWIVANECWGTGIPEALAGTVRELDQTRPIFHEGIRPGDFEGDVTCRHYTGGYPMGAFNTEHLYQVFSNQDHKPLSEGEALFAEGWPLKNADGTLRGERSARGEWDHPDRLSQAEWVRGTARIVRAMRYAGLADSRLYANWWYCFEPIEEPIRPTWDDPVRPGIKPTIMDRAIVNLFDPGFPEVVYNSAREYWRDSFAPVAVFDLDLDAADRIGTLPLIYPPGYTVNRTLVVYNDALGGGTALEVRWRLGVEELGTPGWNVLTQGAIPVEVAYAEKREVALETPIPRTQAVGWLILELSIQRDGREVFVEKNRLGALGRMPQPRITAHPSKFELGRLTEARAGQLRKVVLKNHGGGRTVLWSTSVPDGVVQLNQAAGNLRGEQEVYFRIDPSDLEGGRAYTREVRFLTEVAGETSVVVSFELP